MHLYFDIFSGIRVAKIHVALVPVVAILYNIPRFMEYKVIQYTFNDTSTVDANTAQWETTKIFATVGKHQIFQIGYKNVLFFIVMYIIPLSILTIVSVNLIKTLKERTATLQRIGSDSSNQYQSKREDSITLVLIIIIAAFVGIYIYHSDIW